MSSHAPSVTSALRASSPPLATFTTKQELTTDDADVRASTAMAIVELLATGSSSSASNHTTTTTTTTSTMRTSRPNESWEATATPPLTPSLSPLWVDTRLHRKNSTSSNASNASASGTPIAPFPGLPALLPMKRPLWRTGSTAGASSGDNHLVPIQPLPSIAQLSKLAISATERLSPTAIDGVGTRSSPVLTPTLAPAQSEPTQSGRTKSAAPTSVNHSRKRQKDELDRLRVQVQELQRELEHVRARLPKRSAPALVGPTGAAVSSSETFASLLPTSVAVWERIATHQKEQKNRSEMENMKLKAMVAEQVKISKALEKLVNKRCKTTPLETTFGTKRLRVCVTDEQQIFDALAANIDLRYRPDGAVFEQLGDALNSSSGLAAQMILDPVHGPTMELRDATVFPFDVETISNAVWRAMETEALGCADSMGMGAVAARLIQHSDHTVWTRMRVPLHQSTSASRSGADSELCVRGVIKRFTERQRVVILWESLAECLGSLPLPLACTNPALPPNLEMHDRGWCVIESLPGRMASVVQLCSHVTPRVVGGSASSTTGSPTGSLADGGSHLTLQHMQSLVDALAPCYRYVWDHRQQVMENILMENVVGLPRRDTARHHWSAVADSPVHAAAQ